MQSHFSRGPISPQNDHPPFDIMTELDTLFNSDLITSPTLANKKIDEIISRKVRLRFWFLFYLLQLQIETKNTAESFLILFMT